jgi:hypothetical protein
LDNEFTAGESSPVGGIDEVCNGINRVKGPKLDEFCVDDSRDTDIELGIGIGL